MKFKYKRMIRNPSKNTKDNFVFFKQEQQKGGNIYQEQQDGCKDLGLNKNTYKR